MICAMQVMICAMQVMRKPSTLAMDDKALKARLLKFGG
jgi:hypothetical protein